MKVVRIVVGVLAVVFVLLHLIELPGFMAALDDIPDRLHASRWITKCVAVFAGAGVAVFCFRPKKGNSRSGKA